MRLVAAAVAALALSTPAMAQSGPGTDADALIAQVDTALLALAESWGQPAPPSLAPLIRSFLEGMGPDGQDDPAGASLVMGFDFKGEPRGSGGLLADEAACQALRPAAAVFRFRRFERAGALGHDCVLIGPPDADEGGLWALMSDRVLSDPQGRLAVRFAAVSAADGTADARRTIEVRQLELLRVAEAVSEAGVAVFLGEPVDLQPPTDRD